MNSSREKSFDTSRTIQYDTKLSRHTLAHMLLVPIHPSLYSITQVWIGTSNCRLFRQFLNNICRRLLTTEVTSMRGRSIKTTHHAVAIGQLTPQPLRHAHCRHSQQDPKRSEKVIEYTERSVSQILNFYLREQQIDESWGRQCQ